MPFGFRTHRKLEIATEMFEEPRKKMRIQFESVTLHCQNGLKSH